VNVLGFVLSFDDRRGDGLVRSDAGEDLYFHCVSISDGSRHVDEGERVSARRSVGRRGHDELIAVDRVS
jgi:cold shock CspA family protein